MTPRRLQPTAIGVALCLALVGSACSPGGSSGPASATGGKIDVVAAENFWGSIATQLGGTHVDVRSIIVNPATDPHDYEPTADDGRTVAQAQFVIENGVGYDPWMAKLVAANGTTGQKVLDVGDMLGLKDGDNPHRWYFPSNVQSVIDRITTTYQAIDPHDTAYFDQQRRAFEHTGLADYHRLISEIRSRYAGTPVGASESIFQGIAQATGLDLVTPYPYLRAISEGTDPTASDTSKVTDQITQHQIRVWVFNSQNSTPDIQILTKDARQRGIPVTTITETLAPANASFQQWQVSQLRGLLSALAQGG